MTAYIALMLCAGIIGAASVVGWSWICHRRRSPLHRHTCACGNRWRHRAPFIALTDRAHTCMACGAEVFIKDP